MDTFFDGLGTPVMLLLGAFVGITALLWFLLPFSVFGIKARLDQQIAILRLIERHLSSLDQTVKGMQSAASDAEPSATAEALEPQEPTGPEPVTTGVTDRPEPRNPALDERWQRQG